MFFYDIGYSGPEASGAVRLQHRRSFRRHVWNRMVIAASVKVAQQFYAEECADYAALREQGVAEGDEAAASWLPQYISAHWYRLYERVADGLCEDYGFVRVEATQEFIGPEFVDLRQPRDRHLYGNRVMARICRAVTALIGCSEDDTVVRRKRRMAKREARKGGDTVGERGE